MKKIAALHAYLQSQNLVAAESIESWVEEMQVIPSGRGECTDNGTIAICEEHYTAQFRFNDYPHKRVQVPVLFAHISAWMLEHDADRTLPFQFAVNPEVLDAEIAIIEIGILFVEITLASESPEGDLYINGKQYAVLP